jgi:heat shock protein HslJ
MRKWFGQTAVLILSLLFLLAACGQASDPGGKGGAGLEGTFWALRNMDGKSPLPGSEITAGFKNGEMSGSTGCNIYFTAYSTQGDRLVLQDAAVTEMACMTPEGVMEQESQFLGYLNGLERFEIAGAELHLFDAGGARLIFVPRPPVE